ncbi:MAG: TonB-dependent receptor [Bacteroidales bacterium]|jgi:hypothetical protein|nr:TonB-dependent receptor [Bacteroidales bacterium]
MKEGLYSLTVILFFLFPAYLTAQESTLLTGTVTDSTGHPVEGAYILIEETNTGTSTSPDGRYELSLVSGKSYSIVISHVSYATIHTTVDLKKNKPRTVRQDFTLTMAGEKIPEVSIVGLHPQEGTLQRIETREFKQLPNPSGSIETLIKTLPGVASGNELSAQYSVRGGNFDENLIYVNDIEIHRPFLIRSGQQEGLSFIHPDLVESVDFSPGGFDARYGDKMSSVLDVRYRTPEKFAVNASVSLLGASASIEGLAGKKTFSYLAGIRYKTSQYLLGSLDTEGDYSPDFLDVQSLLRYRMSEKWEIDFLVNIAQNKYHFEPEVRTTNFGTIYDAYQLKIYYDGREQDRYNSGLGAMTLNYRPSDNWILKLNGSAYKAYEKETFDIEASYLLSELESNAPGSSVSDSTLHIGIGSELSHARNYLDASVYSVTHIGEYQTGRHSLQWSVAFRQEITDNKMNEWIMIDSAGYSVPYDGESIRLKMSRYADNYLKVHRLISWVQYRQKLTGNHLDWTITAGLRLNYNDVNRECLVSPRVSVRIQPHQHPRLSAHFAAGLYGQPPSYRELRNTDGNMNRTIKAQRSVHYVIGGEYAFRIGYRPFKLSSEMYYKQLSRLIPYRMENVRIYYAGDNMASGYVTGWDIKLNGEFVKDAESWVGISLMQARGNIKDDGHGSYPLPTDQRVNFNLFFQDYIPGASTWRVFLNLAFSTPLPYNYPDPDRFDQLFRMRAYRRVDIGLSKEFFKGDRSGKVFKQIRLNAEIFNLFDTKNTISYLWVQVVNNQNRQNQQYAVPNYLTARRVNVRLSAEF